MYSLPPLLTTILSVLFSLLVFVFDKFLLEVLSFLLSIFNDLLSSSFEEEFSLVDILFFQDYFPLYYLI